MHFYPDEILPADEDDGTMLHSLDSLRKAVIGHRIMKAEYNQNRDLQIFLDSGQIVTMKEISDCCAYSSVENFILNANIINHIITNVTTTGQYETWHIFADMGEVLTLNIGWSCGNPFYYAYGFDIVVSREK